MLLHQLFRLRNQFFVFQPHQMRKHIGFFVNMVLAPDVVEPGLDFTGLVLNGCRTGFGCSHAARKRTQTLEHVLRLFVGFSQKNEHACFCLRNAFA